MSSGGTGFGHAKVILLGEHAVVHGQPALAAALHVGVRAHASDEGGPLVQIPQWAIDVRPDAMGDDDLVRAMGRLFEQAPPESKGARVVAETEIPSRAGMGSSAALSVAVVRSLADMSGKKLDVATVERLAGLAEEVFHGKASGIDAAVASRGGVLRFLRGTEPESVPSEGTMPVVVAQIQSRVPTRDMVERVRIALEARPNEIRGVFDEIGSLVAQGEAAIRRSDLVELGHLMDANHEALRRLDVSTPELDDACDAARRAGALGAKLTGAGGGGCVIALAPGREDEIASTLRRDDERWVGVSRLCTRGSDGI